jgi:hypothetical protein
VYSLAVFRLTLSVQLGRDPSITIGRIFIIQGGNQMKQSLEQYAIAVVCLFAIVPFFVLTSCQPEPPISVQGSFIFEIIDSSAQSSGNVLTVSGSDAAVWEGSFQGTSTGNFEEIRYETGRGTYRERVTFMGTLEGSEGTLKIHLEGGVSDKESNWEGTWEILEGGDGLDNVQGSGTWIEISDYHVEYTGQVQFAP